MNTRDTPSQIININQVNGNNFRSKENIKKNEKFTNIKNCKRKSVIRQHPTNVENSKHFLFQDENVPEKRTHSIIQEQINYNRNNHSQICSNDRILTYNNSYFVTHQNNYFNFINQEKVQNFTYNLKNNNFIDKNKDSLLTNEFISFSIKSEGENNKPTKLKISDKINYKYSDVTNSFYLQKKITISKLLHNMCNLERNLMKNKQSHSKMNLNTGFIPTANNSYINYPKNINSNNLIKNYNNGIENIYPIQYNNINQEKVFINTPINLNNISMIRKFPSNPNLKPPIYSNFNSSNNLNFSQILQNNFNRVYDKIKYRKSYTMNNLNLINNNTQNDFSYNNQYNDIYNNSKYNINLKNTQKYKSDINKNTKKYKSDINYDHNSPNYEHNSPNYVYNKFSIIIPDNIKKKEITVKIKTGKNEYKEIKVNSETDVISKAKDFCNYYQISDQFVTPLSEVISKSMIRIKEILNNRINSEIIEKIEERYKEIQDELKEEVNSYNNLSSITLNESNDEIDNNILNVTI